MVAVVMVKRRLGDVYGMEHEHLKAVSMGTLEIRSAFTTVMSTGRSEDFTNKCREVTSDVCMVNIYIFYILLDHNPRPSINHEPLSVSDIGY